MHRYRTHIDGYVYCFVHRKLGPCRAVLQQDKNNGTVTSKTCTVTSNTGTVTSKNSTSN